MTIQTVTSNNLDSFNAARMGIADPKPEPKAEPKPEVKEDKPEPVEASTEVKDDAEPEVTEQEPEKPKKPANKLQNRFDEITAAKRAAEDRAAAAEARAAELEAKLKPRDEPKAVDDGVGPKPKASEYTDAFEYAEDLAEWSSKNALRERDVEEAQAKEGERRQKIVDAWVSRVTELKQTRPDYDEMLASSNAAVHDAARDEMMESKWGPDIALALAEDDDLAKLVSAMNPRQQVKWIGTMEAQYQAKPPAAKEETKEDPKDEPAIIKERPKAPAPISPVKGSRGPSAEEQLTSAKTFKEYKAARLRQMNN